MESRVRRLLALVVVATAVIAALSMARTSPPAPPGPIAVRITPVSLNATDPSQTRVGRFVYAGGIALDASPVPRFGGLSDLKVEADGRLLSVTDEGQVVEARLVLDVNGRLTGLRDVRIAPLTGTDGRPLTDKATADSEGIAVLPNGDRLVSFERQHRIWRYPAGGGPPVPAPAPGPAATFPLNSGMEALTTLPADGPGAYLAGSEEGAVWRCTLGDACRETALGSKVPEGFGLTAIGVSPDGQTLALVARSFDLLRGVRVVVRLVGRAAIEARDAPQLDEFALNDPLTRDNFEGIAIVNGAEAGTLRLYMLSDNNYSGLQRTYLLAFDWRPAP